MLDVIEDLETIYGSELEEQKPCQARRHLVDDSHEDCGAPAGYIFRGFDIDCDVLAVRYLCALCAPSIMEAAVLGKWCCVHRDHVMRDISLRRVGL